MLDPDACVTAPDTPITSVIEASTPQLFTTPGFNYSDPDGSAYPDNTICQWSIYLQNYTNVSMRDLFICPTGECTMRCVITSLHHLALCIMGVYVCVLVWTILCGYWGSMNLTLIIVVTEPFLGDAPL
jgi:hypothetical protein